MEKCEILISDVTKLKQPLSDLDGYGKDRNKWDFEALLKIWDYVA